MSKKRNALGRGLSALLDDTSAVETTSFTKPKYVFRSGIANIDVNAIAANPFQPRTDFEEESLKELAASIKVHDIIQPITVRQLEPGQYQLIAGERRLQASKLAGKETIPVYVREANDQQMLEMSLIENIQRENLNAIEIALSYQRLITDCKLVQEELGTRVGKKRTTVNNYLRLLKLPPGIQIAVRDNSISMGHARALISIENIDSQLSIFNKTISEDLSVRKVEALVRALSNPVPKPASSQQPQNNEIIQLQKKLSSHFGSKIVVRSDKANKGEIKIPFVSVADLNRILDILEID